MPARALLAIAVLLSTAGLPARHAPKLNHLLDGTTTLSLTLEAPLQKLFAYKKTDDERVFVPGTLSYKDPGTGAAVVLTGLEVSVRGARSRSG